MPAAPLPKNELLRLRALLDLDVLDSPPEEEFDALVQAAALVCDVPISLISLVDSERQWFKANTGLPGATETPRDMAFCAYAIQQDDILEVEDAQQDQRFCDNPLVTDKPDIRFYAGVALCLTNGFNVGTLCVIDTKPHKLDAKQRAILTHLGAVAVKSLENRRARILQSKTMRQVVRLTEKISSSEARFRALSDASPLGIFETDARGQCIYTNRRWQEIYDLTGEQSLGDGWAQALHPEDKEKVFANWAANAPKGAEYSSNFRIQQQRGQIRNIISRASPLRSSEGEVVGWVGSVEDVTDYVSAMSQLYKSEARYRRLYESTPVMMHSISADGVIVNVSDHWLAVMGYSRDEVIGKKKHLFLTKASADYAEKVVLPQFFKSGHCENVEYQMVTKSGAIIDILLSATLDIREDGSKNTLAVLQNITQSKAAVRTNEAWLGTIRSQYIMSATDRKGNIIEVNDAFCAISQYAREELLGQNHRIVNSKTHPTDFFKDMWRTIASGQPWRGEICNQAKDGSLYWVDSVIVPFLDGAGKVERYISIRSDISSRKTAEANLAAERKTLAAIIEGTEAGTWEWNVPTGHIRFNEQWAKTLGYTLAELEPLSLQTWLELIHPDDLVLADKLLKAHFSGASNHFECEFRMRNCFGEWIWVMARGKLLSRTTTGEPEWMFGTQMDVDLRKKQEQALRQNQVLLSRTGHLAGVGGWELNLETGTLFWSDEVCHIQGVPNGYKPSLAEAIGFYAPEAQPILDAAIDKAIASGESWDLELPLIRRDGQAIWVRTVGSVEFEDGRAVRLIGALQDVTERVNQSNTIRETNTRMALATDSGRIGVWELDFASRRLEWDPWMYRLYGLGDTSSCSIQDRWLHYIHDEDTAMVSSAVEQAFAGAEEFNTEFRIRWNDDSLHYLRATARVTRDRNNNPVKMVGVSWDVTSLRVLAQQLAEQHELLRVTLKSIGDAVITTNANGYITWLNPIAERMTGWTSEEAKNRELSQVFRIIHEETRIKAQNPVAACLEQGKIMGLPSKTLLISRTGEEFGIEDSASPIRNEYGELLGAVLVFHDVTEQRRLSGEISYQASHDALTDLLNRTEFEARLHRLLERCHEEQSSHALMFIDLDQFKIVNDSCGHSAGDQLLQQVSKLFAETVRTRDTLARLGGDEFGLILEHCTTDQARRVAQEICDKMDAYRFIHDDHRFRIGASIGLVTIDNRWPTTAMLMQAADTSCYAAKEAGRNRVHVWYESDEAMLERHGEVQWTTRIEEALEKDLFVLYGQRIESIQSAPTGLHLEVLVRMLDTDGGTIAPSAFFPAAERYHLAPRIDRWVLSQSIAWLEKALPDNPLEMICINLSGQSIGDRAFHHHAVDLLKLAGDKVCSLICLEITETAAITNLADASLFIEQVRSLGVRIALDDFGAGASSFGYLKNLDVDLLKIDGQFIRDLLTDPLDDAAVRCFVDVAKVVGVKTIAEFVETQDVLDRVHELQIDFVQGFLLHRPEPIQNLLQPR